MLLFFIVVKIINALRLSCRNLLTKREALSRSLELQRNGSLKFFAYQRQKAIMELKCRLADLETRRGDDQRESERSLPSCYVNSMDFNWKILVTTNKRQKLYKSYLQWLM